MWHRPFSLVPSQLHHTPLSTHCMTTAAWQSWKQRTLLHYGRLSEGKCGQTFAWDEHCSLWPSPQWGRPSNLRRSFLSSWWMDACLVVCWQLGHEHVESVLDSCADVLSNRLHKWRVERRCANNSHTTHVQAVHWQEGIFLVRLRFTLSIHKWLYVYCWIQHSSHYVGCVSISH